MVKNKIMWKNISYGSLTTFSKKKSNGITQIIGIELNKNQKYKYSVNLVNITGFLNPIRVGRKLNLFRTNSLSDAQSVVKKYVREN